MPKQDEKTPEQKAQELELQLQELEESQRERLAERREELTPIREQARTRAEDLFGEGSLGRVDATTSSELQDLIDQRQALVQEIKGDSTAIEAREDEIDQIRSEFAELFRAADDPRSPAARAARERGRLEIQRGLQGQLRGIAGLANERGTGLQASLVGDALQGATQARAALERDLILESDRAKREIVSEGAAARSESLRRKEDLINQQRAQVDALTQRQEELQGAIRQDLLNRQLVNLDARNRELFGRLSTEEGRVGQELALITGTAAQTTAEIQSVKQNRFSEEQLEIQRIEANKPPPSGGGKWLCTAHCELGNISQAVLDADREYGYNTVDDDAKRGYAFWALPAAQLVLRWPWFARLTAPVVTAWANEMAYRSGNCPEAKTSWLGRFCVNVLPTPCRWLGRFVKWCGWDVDPELKKIAKFTDVEDEVA